MPRGILSVRAALANRTETLNHEAYSLIGAGRQKRNKQTSKEGSGHAKTMEVGSTASQRSHLSS